MQPCKPVHPTPPLNRGKMEEVGNRIWKSAAPYPLLPLASHPCDPVIRGSIRPIRRHHHSRSEPHRMALVLWFSILPFRSASHRVTSMKNRWLKQWAWDTVVAISSSACLLLLTLAQAADRSNDGWETVALREEIRPLFSFEPKGGQRRPAVW